MRKKIEELNDTLAEFVDQGDYSTLVIGADDGSMAVILSTLQGLDQQNGADVFIVIPDDAGPADAYVTTMATRIEGERMVANDMLAKDGKPPWPEVPVACFDARYPYGQRLQLLVDYVRSLMPEGDHRVIWALLPVNIKDPTGYTQVVNKLVPRGDPEPWMSKMRFIVRDDRGQPFLIPALKAAQVPRVLTYLPDFSTGAIEASLGEEALDVSLPMPQRMTSLLQLAALDYSFQRYEAAAEKYRVLLAYYNQTGQKEMQALCFQGMGDMLRRIGRPAEAKPKYEQGLLLVADSQALVVTMNLSMALGDTSMELGQVEEAGGYYQLTDQIATKIVNPFVKADCLEKLGIVMEAQNQIVPAAKIWTDATQLCRQMDYRLRLVSILERLLALYRRSGMTERARTTEDELAGARAHKESA